MRGDTDIQVLTQAESEGVERAGMAAGRKRSPRRSTQTRFTIVTPENIKETRHSLSLENNQ